MSTTHTDLPTPRNESKTTGKSVAMKLLISLALIVFGLIAIVALTLVFALTMAYPNLPELDAITSYRPKLPLRVFSADKVLLAEFGEERRNVMRITEIPDVMKKAVLAIEDDRFYDVEFSIGSLEPAKPGSLKEL